MDIEGAKSSVQIAHNSLQTYGTKDISDSLLKHNIMHLIIAVNELTRELNRRSVLNKQI